MILPVSKTIGVGISASIAVAGLAFAEAATTDRPSAWTPELVASIFLGLTGLLTALLNLHYNRKDRKEMKTDVREIRDMADGTNALLREALAKSNARIADLTGDAGDERDAATAETAAVGKRAVTEAAETKADNTREEGKK